MMGSRARVLVIYTGGTFGMVYKESGNSASPLVPAKLGDLRSAIQEAEPNLGAHYEARCDFILPTEKFVPVDSANIGPAQWKALAHCIKRNYKDYDGFVIIHGTDTLAYSAAALSFMLQNLSKPIVFTGSQIPFVIDRSDGRLNLSNSVAIAGGYVKRPGEILRIPRVMVCFGSELLLGTRARKLSAGSLAGFASPNCAPLAHLGEKIEFSVEAETASRESHGHRLTVQDKFSQSVVDVVLYPGIRADLLRRMLFAKGVEGAILRTFGAGNAPTRDEIVSVFRDAQRRKKVILNVTQCSEGEVDMLLYDVGTSLLEAGVVSGLDITPEAALVKMQWVLADTEDYESRRSALSNNLRGEQSGRIREIALRVKPAGRGDLEWRLETAVEEKPPGIRSARLRLDGLATCRGVREWEVDVYMGLQQTDPGDADHLVASRLGSSRRVPRPLAIDLGSYLVRGGGFSEGGFPALDIRTGGTLRKPRRASLYIRLG